MPTWRRLIVTRRISAGCDILNHREQGGKAHGPCVRVRARKEAQMVHPVVSTLSDDVQRLVRADRWDDSDLPMIAAGSIDAGNMQFGDFHDSSLI
jgi:hypothetical protein